MLEQNDSDINVTCPESAYSQSTAANALPSDIVPPQLPQKQPLLTANSTSDGVIIKTSKIMPDPPPPVHQKASRRPAVEPINTGDYPQRHIGFDKSPVNTLALPGPSPSTSSPSTSKRPKSYQRLPSVEQVGPIGYVRSLALAAKDAMSDAWLRVRARTNPRSGKSSPSVAAESTPKDEASNEATPVNPPSNESTSQKIAHDHSLKDLPALFPLHAASEKNEHDTAKEVDNETKDISMAPPTGEARIVQAVTLPNPISVTTANAEDKTATSSASTKERDPLANQVVAEAESTSKKHAEWQPLHVGSQTLNLPEEEAVDVSTPSVADKENPLEDKSIQKMPSTDNTTAMKSSNAPLIEDADINQEEDEDEEEVDSKNQTESVESTQASKSTASHKTKRSNRRKNKKHTKH
ncbi:hypothetical protein BDF19DRAFT_428676 [Syncephalis fuscata]|nr:hypothetical protein BDF19DRAFT_428676 [Syncephalis fuscata]